MAGHRGWYVTVLARWCLILALGLALCIVQTANAEPQKVYDINLGVQSVADALTRLSEQTGAPVVFSYDLTKGRKANPVSGRYTLQQALDALLEGTGLSGGLSDKGVLTVSAAESGTPKSGETIVTKNDNQQNTQKTHAPRVAAITSFFASIASAFSAGAQESGDSADIHSNLESVVVTAQKHEERLQDTPVSVTVLNPNELMETNQTRLQDYFDLVPGFIDTPQQFGRTSLSFRGISPIGGDPTVGVMIDDVPFGVAGSQQSGYVPDIDPGDLVRIEALSGPQGTLYGTSSMGGLIKFVTKDPSVEAFSGRAEAGTSAVYNGADAGYNTRASVNIPINDVLAIRASGFTRQDPGYIDDPFQHIDGINQTRNLGARMAALWTPSSDFSIRLSALYQDSKSNGLSEAVVATPGYPESYGLGSLQQNYLPGIGHDDLAIQAYSATIKAKIGAFDLVSLTGYNYTRSAFSVPLSTPTSYVAGLVNDPSVIGSPYYELDREDKVSQEIRASSSITKWFDFTLGGFFTHENANGYSDAYGQTPTGGLLGPWFYFDQPISSLDEYAIFGNFTLHITDQFDIVFGGRESYFNQRLGQDTTISAGSTSYSAALSDNPRVFTYLVDPRFKISRDLMVYARFASGYRPGSPNVVLPNVPRESDPDKTRSSEVGIKTDLLNHALSIDGSLYYITWNAIQLEEFTTTSGGLGTFAFTGNAGGAKSEGAELTVSLHPTDGTTIGATFSYDDAVLTKGFPADSSYYGVSGDRLPLTSRDSGSVSIEQEFTLPNAQGFAGAVVAYVGDRLGNFVATPQRQDLPAYTKLDLHAGIRRDSWTITAYANNATDKRGILDGGIGYYYAPARLYITPRTLGLDVSKKF